MVLILLDKRIINVIQLYCKEKEEIMISEEKFCEIINRLKVR